jgi:DNA-binding transcriptional ArsR family regulator
MATKVMSPALMQELSERFKALGEPARLQLLMALRSGEKSVGELVDLTVLGQANVSKHLQQLHACGYITRRKEGTFAYYTIAHADVFMLCDVMCGRIEEEQRERRAALRIAR